MNSQWIARGKDVLDIELDALRAVRDNIGNSFAEAVQVLAACTGRVAVTGLGKSWLVGRKIAATLSSTGTPSYFLHPVEGAHGDLGAVRSDDVVIAISYSGKSSELNAILPALRSLGPHIIALTSGLTSPMSALADTVINCSIPREACPMDLAPTSSTTATLALGDALAVCLMDIKKFTPGDFKKFHPGGALGQRLRLLVKDVMHTQNLPILSATADMATTLTVLDTGKLGAAIITDASAHLLGIVTDGDIRRALLSATHTRKPLEHCQVAELMTHSPRYAEPEQSAAEIMDIMEEKGITVLPVLHADRTLAGIIHLHDLLGKGQIRFSS